MLTHRLPLLTSAIELSDTPFFAQEAYQCGPAALATVLQAADVPVLPQDLVAQVYVPAKQGSLQVEMLAAGRRAGRIPYRIAPELEAIRSQLIEGRPVLVMQNLGLRLLPAWHYAVVVGLDPEADQIVLRSGTERRRLTSSAEFLRTWRLADGWAVVVLRPGELPAEVEPSRYLRAVAMTERFLSPQDRRAAYQAALRRWPDDATAQFGLAFAWHADGNFRQAESGYRSLLMDHPEHAAAWNNLADMLQSRGCHTQARNAAQTALTIARRNYPGLVAGIEDTLRGIPSTPDGPDCASAGLPSRKN